MENTTIEIQPVKLTKKALNEFIGWTSSRYNDYLGFGKKKDNVETCFRSLKNGYLVSCWFRRDKTVSITMHENVKIFDIECANPVGERGTNKKGSYWSTKQGGDKYTIDCVNKTITAFHSKRTIKFL